MLRRSLRRQYRLVRVEVHDRHLNVITGAVWQRALETLRRLAFALTGGSLSVSGGAARARWRASRIHCSLAVQTVCPQCGAVGVKINRQTGMCPLCTWRYHLEQERAFNEQLEHERAACERSDKLADVRRERDKMRQRNSRLCRKYGLKGKRERRK